MLKTLCGCILGLVFFIAQPALAQGNKVSCAFDASEASVKQVIGEGLAADEKARESDAYVGSTNNLGQIAGACAVEYGWNDRQIDAASNYAVARMGREVIGTKLVAGGVTVKALDAGYALLSDAVRKAYIDGTPSDADIEATMQAFAGQGIAPETEAAVIALVQWVTFTTLEQAAARNFTVK